MSRAPVPINVEDNDDDDDDVDNNTPKFNPFAPEPPVTACADPGPFYPSWRHQF